MTARAHIESIWRGWFGQLRPGARIVDLACGSGEVARIACSVSEEAMLRFTIEGFDLAALPGTEDPDVSNHGTAMRLTGAVDLVRLPVSDQTFDAAVSQFGIEYAEPQGACREVARVLKRHGHGLFLVHHSESAIAAAARSRLQASAAILGDGVAFDNARLVYEAIAHHAPQALFVSRLSEFRQTVRMALEMHSAKWPWEGNLREILGFLSDLARNPQMYDPFDALRRLELARDTIMAWQARQQSQLAAARDEQGMQALAGTLRFVGLSPDEISVVTDPAAGAILAWRLSFAARAAA